MTIDPRDYWLNNDGPPYLGPTGLHAWADAILATAQTETAQAIGTPETPVRAALDALYGTTYGAPGVRPESYGAVGDGVTDDTEALAAMAADAAGQVVILRSGATYRLTDTVTLDVAKVRGIIGNNAQVVVDGAFTGLEFVGTHDASASPWMSTVETRDAEFHPIVRDLRIRGNHADSVGIGATKVQALSVVGCYIHDIGTGIHLHHRARNVIVAASHIYHCRYGIHFDECNTHQGLIYGCHISYAVKCIYVDGGDVHNWTVAGCIMEAQETPDYGDPANLIHIVADPSQGSQVAWQITGCQLNDHWWLTGPAVHVEGASHAPPGPPLDVMFSVTHCTFDAYASGAIKAENVTSVLIDGCMFYHGSPAALPADTGYQVEIAGLARACQITGNLSHNASGLAKVHSTQSSTDVRISDNYVYSPRHTRAMISVTGDGGIVYGVLDVSGNIIRPYTGNTYSSGSDPIISITPSEIRSARVCGNQINASNPPKYIVVSGTVPKGVFKDNVGYVGGSAVATPKYTFPTASAGNVIVADNV